MELATRLVDYKVLIGTSLCVGKDLTDNALRCQPPVDEPSIDLNSTELCARKKMNVVTVTT